ncbi:hypothetical protein Tco_0828871, partial [Tanacetum coccineum]
MVIYEIGRLPSMFSFANFSKITKPFTSLRIGMRVPTKRQGDSVCLAAIEDSREELYHAWFRVRSKAWGAWVDHLRSWGKIYFAVLVNTAEGIGNTAEIGEIWPIGLELVQETTNKVILIKEKLKRLEIAKRAMLAIGEYWMDVNMHVPLEEIKVHKTLHFVEEPVEIIDHEVKSLKRSSILIVKVCWDSKRCHEDFMRTNYSHLLIEQVIVGNDRLCTLGVIKNGNTAPKTTFVEGVEKVMPPTTAEEKAQKRLELELFGETISQENVNQKLLRSLSPEGNTHVVVWRNKTDLDTMSMDDLYNNLKVYEPEVKGMSSSSSSTQNMAFVSSSNNNNSSTN